jgi:hypothetical protein
MVLARRYFGEATIAHKRKLQRTISLKFTTDCRIKAKTLSFLSLWKKENYVKNKAQI